MQNRDNFWEKGSITAVNVGDEVAIKSSVQGDAPRIALIDIVDSLT
ncbi:hypothetical protein ACOI4C_20575 [Escherichia coli]|nr:hypothetical protein [Escherichia coli]MCW7417995.1 hypothetical protein [Escherichia coli]MCZ5513800.1 hypothetical protein [Escherichia coli]MDW9205640.1 hypothetical protein [Escherichia coli]MDW9218061.1 hypothetical protein [Escherichia coli]MDX1834421.1 hypothetical protein [Escherichia coli]